nr:capsid protein [Statovirus 0447]
MSKLSKKQMVNSKGNNRQSKQNNKQNNYGYIDGGLNRLRLRRKELWFSIFKVGQVCYDFDSTTYPSWFNRMASMYENYEMHEIRIHWVSSYSRLSTGTITISYNSTYNDQYSYEPTIMLAQEGAKSCQISKSGSITIPKNAYTRTPSKRPCRGQDSWLFQLIISVQTQEESPIQFFIEYDATFRVPQLNPDPTFATISSWEQGNRNNNEKDSSGRARFIERAGRYFLIIQRIANETIQIATRVRETFGRLTAYNGDSLREIIQAIDEGEEDTKNCSYLQAEYLSQEIPKQEQEEGGPTYESKCFVSTGGQITKYPVTAKGYGGTSQYTRGFNEKVTFSQLSSSKLGNGLATGPNKWLFDRGKVVVLDLGTDLNLFDSLIVSSNK